MVKDPTIKVRPWCPFCGQDVGTPQEPVQRKLDEFKVGTCLCGAVYTSDPTGFNVGAAMVEAMNYACDDNWDLAWDLTPDDDYLTGRIDNYDEETHQVYETKNVDGRKVSGVLYFVRLTKDIAELSKNLNQQQEKKKDNQSVRASNKFSPPAMEEQRDPKRKRKRANKGKIKELALAQDIDSLVDLALDDIRTLRFLQRLLYDPSDDNRWLFAHTMGQVCARVSTRKPGAVSDLLHRMFEACTDSAATHWGLIESIGSIIAARADIYGAFARHLLMYRGVESSQVHVLWAMGTIAEKSPEMVLATPIYALFPFLGHDDASIRGHSVRLFGRIKAEEVRNDMEKLADDESELIVYEQGVPHKTTIAQLVKEALDLMNSK